MTSSQLILVAVTSALISVFTMLFVATLRRARTRDNDRQREVAAPPISEPSVTTVVEPVTPAASQTKPVQKRPVAKKTTTQTQRKATTKKTSARKTPAARKRR